MGTCVVLTMKKVVALDPQMPCNLPNLPDQATPPNFTGLAGPEGLEVLGLEVNPRLRPKSREGKLPSQCVLKSQYVEDVRVEGREVGARSTGKPLGETGANDDLDSGVTVGVEHPIL